MIYYEKKKIAESDSKMKKRKIEKEQREII